MLILPGLLFSKLASGKYMCVGVSDGDTIWVMIEGEKTRVKIDGVDCPELGQEFGINAKQFTSDLVSGKVIEVNLIGIGESNTPVAYILVEKDDVGIELLKAGLAWNLKRYKTDDPIYAYVEQDAKAGKVGLWSMANPIAPWDYRNEALRLLDKKPFDSSSNSPAMTSKPVEENKESEPETIKPKTTLYDYEVRRMIGLDEFEREIYELSKKANEMDIQYTRYRDACMFKYTFGTASVFTYGRTWFSVWEGNVSINNESTPECRKIWSDFSRLTREIKVGIEYSMGKARKFGVYPGQMRKVREKYYLDWSGWD